MAPNDDNLRIQKFMALLVPNQRRIHAYILYLVPNSSDAEDILQETLAEIWNKFDDFKEGSNGRRKIQSDGFRSSHQKIPCVYWKDRGL